MLAQNFKTAAYLGITEEQKGALIKTLVLFETGKLEHIPTPSYDSRVWTEDKFSGKFNMSDWTSTYEGCGTVACIGGTAELISGVDMHGGGRFGTSFYRLFYPELPDEEWPKITVEQAAAALRSYLTTGDPRWDLAVAS